jgi:putative ABC transport system substrate-binding protein
MHPRQYLRKSIFDGYRKNLIAIFFLLVSMPIFAHASDKKIAVVYPVVEKPYSTIFEQIIDGISSVTKNYSVFGLEKDFDTQDEKFREWASAEKPDVIIALGRRGIEGAHSLNSTIPIVYSGILYKTDTLLVDSQGISLTPDPALLFRQLNKLSSKTKRVFVIYNPDRYQWLINIAEEVAKSYGIILEAESAYNLRESAMKHRKILRGSKSQTDALWILHDPSIIASESILPMILKDAWNKHLVVFSSNPSDVPRGALFSFYADHKALGKRLATVAIDNLSSGNKTNASIIPLKDVLTAINIRTAGHIGLHIPYEEQRKFNLIFPRR